MCVSVYACVVREGGQLGFRCPWLFLTLKRSTVAPGKLSARENSSKPFILKSTVISDKTLIFIFHKSRVMKYSGWFGVIHPNAINRFCEIALNASFLLF